MSALCAGAAYGDATDKHPASRIRNVKTTAYTHTESDHLIHGTGTAAGGTLKYGATRSAAADWSIYPVGTVFKIDGDAHVYEVDDYGSALVGTRTIDLYKPSKASMDQWGARKVDIKVVKWGSTARSLAILRPRIGKAPHIAEMIHEIQRKAAS
jgi:3D (Asp-Asp-Asp) domain-containing protein